MSSTKKWKVVVPRNDRDDPDESVLSLACSNSTRFRQPIVLKPGIIEQRLEGNEVIQRWGLLTPCECGARDNTADVIVSAIAFWEPSALLKMLDLSISQFYWSTSTYNMEFCVKRLWNFLRCHVTKSDRMLAEKLGQSLPWRQELLREFEFEFYITMKDGHCIQIDESEAAGRNATVADKRSISKQVTVQSGSDIEIETATTNATSTKKMYPPYLPGTNKRKHIAE
ncbi:hypothetical protein BTUL_0032g00080 [Botrytis tulipae]|uniref:Uncharacterized protein n=1 Tax=Botrytis tulipae TaxID=87230 RepID=A0A4Z1EV21_9HELO|nr:hypothetical protein BTUL_0032g00080 [Botrytis tulipae]